MKRKVYTRDFKKETVHQVLSQDINRTHLAKSIGISKSMLYRWIEEFGPSGKQELSNEERSELAHLRKAHKRLLMEHEILKKAIAYDQEQRQTSSSSSKK